MIINLKILIIWDPNSIIPALLSLLERIGTQIAVMRLPSKLQKRQNPKIHHIFISIQESNKSILWGTRSPAPSKWINGGCENMLINTIPSPSTQYQMTVHELLAFVPSYNPSYNRFLDPIWRRGMLVCYIPFMPSLGITNSWGCWS